MLFSRSRASALLVRLARHLPTVLNMRLAEYTESVLAAIVPPSRDPTPESTAETVQK